MDEFEWRSRCPVCGDFGDYCQGHGTIGDARGAFILDEHDEGNHTYCHPLSDCKVSTD
jgi:hypothetical protein